MFLANKTNSWLSAREFCHSKGADLCPLEVLCSKKDDPFGGVLKGTQRTPIHTHNKWINIGTLKTVKQIQICC